MKKFLALLLSALMLLPLGGCAGRSGKTITVMGKKSDLDKSYMREIFSLYKKETGTKIKLITYSDEEYEERAAEAFAAGDVPDIFQHFHNADLGRFDIENNFMYLNDQPWIDELTDSARAYCENADGNILGLPFWENSVSGCYYNKTILESLGLRPAATQAEFDTLCAALVSAGYTPICWASDGCSWMTQFALDPIFADNPDNLERINRNAISYADLPEVKAMAEWIYNANEKGWLGPDALNTKRSDISKRLSSGNAVMTFIWDTWFYTDFKAGKYSVDDFGLMPVFMNTADGGTYEGGNLNMLMVNKNGENVEDALDFLSFCATPENYNAAFDGISTVSVFKGQTTNIQSRMVVDARASVGAHERVSVAASRIIGYSGDSVLLDLNDMLRKKTDPAGFVAAIDEKRKLEAKNEGAEGF